jgi:hypothetical protein
VDDAATALVTNHLASAARGALRARRPTQNVSLFSGSIDPRKLFRHWGSRCGSAQVVDHPALVTSRSLNAL